MGTIKLLSPTAARLIAAGEVIDRPASALRELLDNALDAGARDIAVRIESGGIELIRVVDDGAGMDAEDTAMSVRAHATSKISGPDDLLRVTSLGFRGEALASIAAAARLEIISRDESSAAGTRLVSGPGQKPRLESIAARRGSTISVSGLFHDFPARRRFLKRPQAEAALCRQIFMDRAMAYPERRFSFESGTSKPDVMMPSSHVERAATCYPEPPRSLLHELGFSGQGFSGRIVMAGPSFYRNDRRLMQVFVNRRRLPEWSFLQSLDYAYQGFLPGGAHPAVFLFLEIDPSLVDFNIHPAKREARFKDAQTPRRALVESMRSFLSGLARRDPAQVLPDSGLELGFADVPESRVRPLGGGLGSGGGHGRKGFAGHEGLYDRAFDPPAGRHPSSQARVSWDELALLRERAAPPPSPKELPFRYLGQALGPFLVFEMEDSLYLLDQHAAHERILFDRFSQAPAQSQELLLPRPIETESDEQSEALVRMIPQLEQAGFRIEKGKDGLVLRALPAELGGDPEGALLELLDRGADDPLREARALRACRAAVKDGEVLDRTAAEELIAQALALPEPRCPHGRPIWTSISREQLYRLVRRLV